MPVVINGKSLTIDKVVEVARKKTEISVSEKSWNKINSCRKMLEEKINNHEIMYGITTGIGEFSEVTLDPNQTKEFQKLLIYSHAAGIGDPMDIEIVRGAMCGRINVHSKGYSGGRKEITEYLIQTLNHDLTPVVCEKGSVGACGDLSPMSQIALALMGEGEMFDNGKIVNSKEALKKIGLKPLELEARDGLALINGSNVLTALAAIILYDAKKWMKLHDIAAAMTLEALMANMKPYDMRIHQLRGFTGSQIVANNLNKLTEESEILFGGSKKVQDAYSMRSTPQVAGTLRDSIDYAASQVEIELNGVGDNPIFLTKEKDVLTGANFQGTPIALPMEMVGTGLSMVAVLSERRMNRLTNPALSVGLPPFLAEKPGLHSGMMLSQYTADALIAETRILSHPAANQSIPAAADQEDFVSMGLTTSQKTKQILDNCYGVLAIEMMAAAQALDMRKKSMGVGTSIAHRIIRENIDYLDEDRPLYNDHNKMVDILKSERIIDEVENKLNIEL
ncbi:MAG: aromatic amino acid ammonia-lyase [Candidatus Thermoplasmatota archaeon]|nr:aromatic amino acid ammonia-lyase [Candidatus Thermoplasmatota archaeon]MEC8073988.1 aromatic amino acid ammonia-lyase [Candidatus Thermoplasmatota archaeon]MEC8446148.1 aromatic amino acid ammonia-lyase [Candidatus Thermoplasmatota archaeon]MEC8671523.1 aromatic amino acid ammonia-lyase [Candidatus Thermoplasmatota archaeon]MEE3081634.1 aromatic amino acid ammonia-lyase [Candidatus Thermoplasmatota archaeon]